MPIRIEQPGAAKAAAQAGTIIGKAQAAEKARQEAIRQQEAAARRASEQRAMEWELEKMTLRSQQDFQQELQEKQYEYDKWNRAKEWDIEKMGLRSQLDFQQEEQKRMQNLERIDNEIMAIEKEVEEGRVDVNDSEYQNRLTSLEDRRLEVKTGAKVRRPTAPRPKSLTQQRSGIEAAYELEGFTSQDLVDLGLDPAEYPAVSGTPEIRQQPTREELRQIGTEEAYEIGKRLGYWN